MLADFAYHNEITLKSSFPICITYDLVMKQWPLENFSFPFLNNYRSAQPWTHGNGGAHHPSCIIPNILNSLPSPCWYLGHKRACIDICFADTFCRYSLDWVYFWIRCRSCRRLVQSRICLHKTLWRNPTPWRRTRDASKKAPEVRETPFCCCCCTVIQDTLKTGQK